MIWSAHLAGSSLTWFPPRSSAPRLRCYPSSLPPPLRGEAAGDFATRVRFGPPAPVDRSGRRLLAWSVHFPLRTTGEGGASMEGGPQGRGERALKGRRGSTSVDATQPTGLRGFAPRSTFEVRMVGPWRGRSPASANDERSGPRFLLRPARDLASPIRPDIDDPNPLSRLRRSDSSPRRRPFVGGEPDPMSAL